MPESLPIPAIWISKHRSFDVSATLTSVNTSITAQKIKRSRQCETSPTSTVVVGVQPITSNRLLNAFSRECGLRLFVNNMRKSILCVAYRSSYVHVLLRSGSTLDLTRRERLQSRPGFPSLCRREEPDLSPAAVVRKGLRLTDGRSSGGAAAARCVDDPRMTP